MNIIEKDLSEILLEGEPQAPKQWCLKSFASDECMTYVAWNESTHELIVIDPRRDGVNQYLQSIAKITDAFPIAVIDTHTHADHISGAFEVSKALGAPLFMHHLCPSQRIDFRVSSPCGLRTRAGELRFLLTPGHTPDGLTVTWGPFVFTGDTILMGDVGRDDLPGGDPAEHYDSVQMLKRILSSQVYVLPGHDGKKGQSTTWATQLKRNASLTQEREDFIRECASFDAAAPSLFKKSLVENFK